MWVVAAAWIYVVSLMAVAEAVSPQGSLLGAAITLLGYGLLPLGIVLYILGAPARWRRRKAQEAPRPSQAPDGGRHATGDAVAPEREEP
jgi:membrane protein implicated in regulation of membrane protease activity